MNRYLLFLFGYTNANIQVGEELTINQLLHVLLINSANEAANILAEHIAGSVNAFANMMNAKATELGCLNTHFVNPNGVHNENHYSTAYDLALMGRYAMQNDTFREIVNTTFYTLPATNKYDKNDRVFGTTNDLIKPNTSDRVDNYYYEYCNGIKTGYTNAAKNCIVTSAEKDGVQYIVVILGAGTTENGLSARYLDCITLFNYAFENYNVRTLHEANSILKTTKISNASLSTKNLDILVQDDISVLLKNDTDVNSIIPNIELNADIKAPITEGSVIGKVTYSVDGNEYSSVLLAGSEVIKSNAFNTFLTIASIIVVLFLLHKLLATNNKSRRRKSKNSRKKSNTRNNYLYW